jgi:hypothetical protein
MVVKSGREVSDRVERLQNAVVCPSLHVWDRLSRLPGKYCSLLGRYPWAFASFYSIALIIAVSTLWRELTVNSDIETFNKVDANATMRQDVYDEARRHLKQKKSPTILADREVYELTLFYRAKDSEDHPGDGSVMSDAALRDIQAIEQELLTMPGWIDLCSQSDRHAQYRCYPGESVSNYFWPTRRNLFINASGEFGLAFEGNANEMMPVPAVLTYIKEAGAPLSTMKFLPIDSQSSDSKELRSIFSFTAPGIAEDQVQQFKENYEEFMRKDLYPKLLEIVERSRKEPDPESWDDGLSVQIFFAGDLIDGHEVSLLLDRDMKKVSGCLVFTFLLAWLHLRSLFLALFGTWLLCMAPLLAYGILARVVEQVSLASFVGVFLIFGLGGNALYYAADAWRRSKRDHQNDGDRLMALHQTIFLMLIPPLAAAGIFFVLFLSLLRPMREMGMFAGACLLCNVFLCVTIFVPILVLHEHCVRPYIERKCSAQMQMILEPPTAAKFAWKTAATKCVEVAARGKYILVGTAVVVLILFVVTVGVTATQDDVSGLPEIFPPDHHRIERREVSSAFSTPPMGDRPSPYEVKFCEPQVNGDCALHWCEAPWETRDEPEKCQCFSDREEVPNTCNNVRISTRLSGSPAAALDTIELKSLLKDYLARLFRGTVRSAVATPSSEEDGGEIRRLTSASAIAWEAGDAESLRSLVLENWETGKISVEPLTDMPKATMNTGWGNGNQIQNCSMNLLCHCGPRACSALVASPNMTAVESKLELQSSRRLADLRNVDSGASPEEGTDRRLATDGAVSTKVTVVFGIKPPTRGKLLDGVPEWEFDGQFDAASPGAQRAMYEMCMEVEAGLNVQSTTCWIVDFKRWLEEDQLLFPRIFPSCRFCNFQDQVDQFLMDERYSQYETSMWRDADNKLVATEFSFLVKARSDFAEVLEDEQRWIDYVQKQNNDAESTASRAWATSKAWVDAEARDEALASSWWVVLASLLLLTLASLCYTMDLKMTATIGGVTICCAIVLYFFMFCLFQWGFGAWELVISIVFLCYALEPALRIGHLLIEIVEEPAGGDPVSLVPDPERAASAERPALAAGGAAGVLSDSAPAEGEETEPDISPALALEVVEPAAPPKDDASSSGSPKGKDITSSLVRAVYLVIPDTVMISLKLWICGFFLLVCESRLFTRLGALSFVLPLVWLPAVLLLLPAAILFSGRTDRRPDTLVLWGRMQSKVSLLVS